MSEFAFLVDEHVPRVFTSVLQSAGFDVATVQERYGQESIDEQLLADCAEERRIVITNDRDFVRLAVNRNHAGIVMYTDRSLLLENPVTASESLATICRHYSPDEMANVVEWLDNWVNSH